MPQVLTCKKKITNIRSERGDEKENGTDEALEDESMKNKMRA